jgi:hypothetical protein
MRARLITVSPKGIVLIAAMIAAASFGLRRSGTFCDGNIGSGLLGRISGASDCRGYCKLLLERATNTRSNEEIWRTGLAPCLTPDSGHYVSLRTPPGRNLSAETCSDVRRRLEIPVAFHPGERNC